MLPLQACPGVLAARPLPRIGFCDNVGVLAVFSGGVPLRSDLLRTATFILCSSLIAFSQDAPAVSSEYSFTISGAQPWTDTGVDLSGGDTLGFTAGATSGTNSSCASQGGAAPSSSDKLPLSDAPAGALVAKTSDRADPVLVGSSGEVHSDVAGHLFLGLNQTAASGCAFAVKLTITHAQAATTAAAQPHSMKDQLSSAAKVWMTGQFGSSS